jgi:hypothetical protein
MSSPVELPCPNCEESLKIPPAVFGKKIKCKHCGHAFVVQDPNAKPPAKSAKPAKPPKPDVKPPQASPPPPAPPAEPKKPNWDDDDDNMKVELIQEEDIPRCPDCAKELDPPDAIICIHCGFNNRTRARAETKKVWAPDAMDWFMHLLPGIIALSIVIGLIVFNTISILSMRDWLTDTFLEMDAADAAGRKRFYVPPGAFIFFLLVISIPVFVPSVQFAFKRLVINYRPAERVKQ